MHATHPDELDPIVLTVPGLNGSGPTHWQSLWESSRPDTHRVELGMWSSPRRNAWVTKLDQAIRAARAPVILAAHSLGCLAVAWWAQLAGQPYGWPVAGALLVAPADVDRVEVREELREFGPSPKPFFRFRRSWSRAATMPGSRRSMHAIWRRSGGAISSTLGRSAISMPRAAWAGGMMARRCSNASFAPRAPTIRPARFRTRA